METIFTYCDEDLAYFSSDERKWINRVRGWKKDYPDEIEILKEPEQNDGCIYARVPAKWLKLRPPKKMNFTDEQRKRYSERMRIMNETNVMRVKS